MKLFLPQRAESTKGHVNLHYGRFRAIKDASEIDSHTRLGSDMGATRDATHSFLISQSVEGSFEDSNDGKHQEEEVSDTLNSIDSRRNSLWLVGLRSPSQILRVNLRGTKLLPYPSAPWHKHKLLSADRIEAMMTIAIQIAMNHLERSKHLATSLMMKQRSAEPAKKILATSYVRPSTPLQSSPLKRPSLAKEKSCQR